MITMTLLVSLAEGICRFIINILHCIIQGMFFKK